MSPPGASRKGSSFERKYLLSRGDTKRYLLRIVPLSGPGGLLLHKQAEFEVVRRFQHRFTFPHSCRNAVPMKSGNLTPTSTDLFDQACLSSLGAENILSEGVLCEAPSSRAVWQ